MCAALGRWLSCFQGWVENVGSDLGRKVMGYLRSLATFRLGTMISLKMGT